MMDAKEKALLDDCARVVADIMSNEINRRVARLAETPSMPYRTQYILEEAIKILQARV